MQCLGRTRNFVRCQNKGTKVFCSKHKYQKWISLSFILLTIIPGGIAYYSIYPKIIGTDNSLTKEDFLDLKKTMIEEFNSFKIPDTTSEISYPGFGINIWVKLTKRNNINRKYIFDGGQALYKNRASLYLDAYNNLVFEIYDNYGEVYNSKVESNKIQFEEPVSLFVEYGISSEFSFLRIFQNNILIKQDKFDFKVEYLPLIKRGMIIFADMNGVYNTSMKLISYAVLDSTLSKSGRDTLYHSTKKLQHSFGRL